MKKILLAALAASFLAGTAFAANGAMSKTGKGTAELKTVAKNLQNNTDRKTSQKDKTGTKKRSKVTATNKKSPTGRGNTKTKKSMK
jgi:hypothetical protein